MTEEMTDESFEPQLELVVVAGRKQGARVALQYGCPTTVGIGYDCDVVLDLPGTDDALSSVGGDTQRTGATNSPVVELCHSEDQLSFIVLTGSVTVDGQNIEPGMESNLATGTAVRLQDHVFEVRSNSDHEIGVMAENLPLEQLAPDSQEPLTLTADTAVPAQRGRRLFAGAMQSVAGVLVLAGSFWAYANIERPEPATIDDVLSGVESDLQTGGFGELDVVLQDDNTIAINGYLQNRSDLYQAREQVQAPETVQWDVKLGDSLAESVGSVYRVNGIDAEVAVLGEGAVAVNTATNDLDLLRRVEKSLYQDVADLRELELNNDEPVIEVEEPPPQRVEDLPGKRIVMIVASEPTFIQTEDGSRYFEGSILPSGHLITAILDEKVQLLLDGKQIELSF